MTHADVHSWIGQYVDAWRSAGTAKLAGIFTDDIRYHPSPWQPPIKGLAELEKFWEQARSGSDEAFKIQHEIVAAESQTAVVRVTVTYANDTPARWRDIWIINFNEAGQCRSFEEWPFAADS